MARRFRDWYPAIAVFIFAATVQAVYLSQISEIGFFRRPLSDAYVYEQRARQIAAGDWLGPADFVHAPLYAYSLGVVRIIGGEGPWPPRCLHIALGAASSVLVMAAGRRFFGPRAGLAAGLAMALFPPVIFFAGLLQKTSLALFLCALLIRLLAWARDKPGLWRWADCGIVMALLMLTQQSAAALIPLVALWLWFTSRSQSRRRRGLWLVTHWAMTTLVLLPWAVRNRVVLGEFAVTTPNMGQNFAMGNNPRATGTYLPFRRGRANAEHEQEEWVKSAQKAVGRTLSPGEVSDYYLNAAIDYICGHPGEWMRLLMKKIALVWNTYETPDTEDYYLYLEQSSMLRTLDRVFHFGVLAALAAAGAVLAIRDARRHWILHGWLLTVTAAVATFVVFARYRVLLVPVLVLFAGALAEPVSRWRTWPARRWLSAMLAAAVVAILSAWPLGYERRPYSFSYANHAVALADLGGYDEALSELDKALKLEPQNVDAMMVRGSVYLDLNRCAEALDDYQQARVKDPGHAPVHRGVADALACLHRFEESAESYREAIAVDANDAASVCGLATLHARLGHFNESVELFQRALALQPDRAETHLNLGNTYLAAGLLDEAHAEYEGALRCRADYPDAWYNLGVIEAQRGGAVQAGEFFRRALDLQPDHAAAKEAMGLLGKK